jgi:uncharacterized cupin superfamily protein
MPAIIRFDPPVSAPQIDQPRVERREQGAPQRATWTLYEAPQGDLSTGIWTCEVGRWRIEFAPGEDEYFFLLEGVARLHDDHGGVVELRAGQAAVIPGGFTGSFEVVEPVRKHFVVIDRKVLASPGGAPARAV